MKSKAKKQQSAPSLFTKHERALRIMELSEKLFVSRMLRLDSDTNGPDEVSPADCLNDARMFYNDELSELSVDQIAVPPEREVL